MAYYQLGRHGRLQGIGQLMRALAHAAVSCPYRPQGIAEALLPAVPVHVGWLFCGGPCYPARLAFSPRKPSIASRHRAIGVTVRLAWTGRFPLLRVEVGELLQGIASIAIRVSVRLEGRRVV